MWNVQKLWCKRSIFQLKKRIRYFPQRALDEKKTHEVEKSGIPGKSEVLGAAASKKGRIVFWDMKSFVLQT